jgi:transposase
VSARNDSTLNREFVKISSVDSTFVSRSMKLRVALLALQEFDELVQRMRSLCAQTQSMKRSTSSDDTNVSNVVLSSNHENEEQSSSTSFAKQASSIFLAVFTHASRNDLENANKF